MQYAISKIEINKLPLLQFSSAIHVIREDCEVEAALAAAAPCQNERDKQALKGFRVVFREGA